MMIGGIMILLQQPTQSTSLEKRHLVSENPPATSFGVNSFFPEKVIINLRNGITCEVLMGYEINLINWTPVGFQTQIWKFDPG